MKLFENILDFEANNLLVQYIFYSKGKFYNIWV